MSHQLIWETKGLYRLFGTKVSGMEVFDSNLSIHGDERFDQIKYIINDFSHVSEFDVSNMEVLKIATVDDVASISNATLKIAIVASLESLLPWVYMYCDYMQDSPYECRHFYSLDAAQHWVSEKKVA